jgi:hypothetical protein
MGFLGRNLVKEVRGLLGEGLCRSGGSLRLTARSSACLGDALSRHVLRTNVREDVLWRVAVSQRLVDAVYTARLLDEVKDRRVRIARLTGFGEAGHFCHLGVTCI